MNRRHYSCCRISVIIVRAVIGILFGLIKTTYFKLGSIFKTAYKIYKFDSEVRKMVIVEVEKIEIAARTQTVYILSLQYGAC